MKNEKFKELWYDDQLEKIEDDIDGSWRHGNHHNTIFKHGNDYWSCFYSVSGDGEYHGIREGEFELTKVYPKTVVTKSTTWTTDMPDPKASTDRYIRTFHEVEAIRYPEVVTDPTDIDAIAAKADQLLRFEEWFERNEPDSLVRYKGSTVEAIIDGVDTTFPAGTWFVKEPGRPVYALSPEIFDNLYEKV